MRGVVIVGAFLSCSLACAGDAEGPCEDDGFAAVTIELQRAAGESISPFIGTVSITTRLDHDDCMADWYLHEAPNYQFDGVDGGEVLDEWMRDGRLCDQQCYAKPIPECTVLEMSQTLNTQGTTDLVFLSVTHEVASDDLEGRHLPIGPFPTESLTGCSPTVSLVAGGLQGFDADGQCLWKVASFDNPTAAIGQTASITIFAEPCD